MTVCQAGFGAKTCPPKRWTTALRRKRTIRIQALGRRQASDMRLSGCRSQPSLPARRALIARPLRRSYLLDTLSQADCWPHPAETHVQPTSSCLADISLDLEKKSQSLSGLVIRSKLTRIPIRQRRSRSLAAAGLRFILMSRRPGFAT